MPIDSPTKDDFAQLLMDRIRQAGEESEIVYELDEFRLRGQGERAGVLSLHNAYHQFCAVEADSREQVLSHWIRHWFVYLREIPDDFEDAKPDLMPYVRSQSQFNLESLREEVENGKSLSWPFQVLGEHFGVGLVYNLPGSMLSIPQAKLDAWGVTFDEAMAAARENLAALPTKFVGPESGEGAFMSANGDCYDATRLVLTEIIRQVKVKGDRIVMIPSRERLIVVGADDDVGLSLTLELVSEAMQLPHSISGIALRLDGDQWFPWLPDLSHPRYNDFRELYLQSLGQEYAAQKELLDKVYESNDAISVATFSAADAPDGRLVSYAVWMAGVESLLPKSDVVVLGRFGGQPQMVQWQTVIEVAGELLEALDTCPPRYRVRNFPTDEQLAAMGNMLN